LKFTIEVRMEIKELRSAKPLYTAKIRFYSFLRPIELLTQSPLLRLNCLEGEHLPHLTDFSRKAEELLGPDLDTDKSAVAL